MKIQDKILLITGGTGSFGNILKIDDCIKRIVNNL